MKAKKLRVRHNGTDTRKLLKPIVKANDTLSMLCTLCAVYSIIESSAHVNIHMAFIQLARQPRDTSKRVRITNCAANDRE